MEAGKDGASAKFDIRESQRLEKEATKERSKELKIRDTRGIEDNFSQQKELPRHLQQVEKRKSCNWSTTFKDQARTVTALRKPNSGANINVQFFDNLLYSDW